MSLPAGAAPAAAVPAGGAGRIAVPSAFQTLVQAADQPGQYLIEITGFRGDPLRLGGRARVAGVAPARLAPARVPASQTTAGDTDTLRYGDRHWVGDPTDADRPNTYYEGRAISPLTFTRQIGLTPQDSPRLQRQLGEIEIANGDGALDSVVSAYAIDGRQIRVLFGPAAEDGSMAPYSDFGLIADVLGVGWEADDLTVRLSVRDRRHALMQPLQNTLYAGTGGAEGNDEVEGKPKPLTFGRARNITPTLIDPTNLVYQFHDGVAHAVDDVFDRGAALTLNTDVSGYANLIAASPSPGGGKYTTALDVGMFRLHSSPAGLITADVRGDATPDYQNTLDTIAIRLLTTYAGLTTSVIDSGSWAGIAALGGELGIYISSNVRPSTEEVLDNLVAGAAGFWGGDRRGRIKAGRLTRPESSSPVFTFDSVNVLSLEAEPQPTPAYRARVLYKPNWTQQRGEDLAASVTDARRQFLTETERAVTALDTSIRTRHLQAEDPPPIFSYYESATDAQAIADDVLARHKADRRLYRLTAKRIGYLLNLNQVVKVTWPRLGMTSGKTFTVIGIREDAERDETELRLWG